LAGELWPRRVGQIGTAFKPIHAGLDPPFGRQGEGFPPLGRQGEGFAPWEIKPFDFHANPLSSLGPNSKRESCAYTIHPSSRGAEWPRTSPPWPRFFSRARRD